MNDRLSARYSLMVGAAAGTEPGLQAVWRSTFQPKIPKCSGKEHNSNKILPYCATSLMDELGKRLPIRPERDLGKHLSWSGFDFEGAIYLFVKSLTNIKWHDIP